MASSFRTHLTTLLGIRTPVVGAAMAKASGGALAAHVTLGGGFGFMSVGYQNAKFLEKELSIARSLLSSTSWRSSPRLPIGIGFFGWELEQKPEAVEVLTYTLRLREVLSVWLSCGNDLPRWIRMIREADQDSERTLIFVQVNTTAEAVKAYKYWDIDVLIVQGNEGGGHGLGKAPPLITLLPSVMAAIKPFSSSRSVPLPILGAGGIATGPQLAAILALGGSGAVVGTRLTISPESLIPETKRRSLLDAARNSKADDNPTIRSSIFDDLMGVTSKWPDGITARGLRMNAMLEDEASGMSIEERRKRYEAEKGDGGTHEIVWSGTSIGLSTEAKSATEIIRELHDDTIGALTKVGNLLAD